MELRSGANLGHFHESNEMLKHIAFITVDEDQINMIFTSDKQRVAVSELNLHEAVKLRNELQNEIDKLTNEA